MEYLEFKNLCESISLGNKKIPDDKSLIPIINLAYNDMANLSKPFCLISKDATDEPLRYIDEEYFIKKPKPISAIEDEIIMDSELMGALAHSCCIYFVSNDNKSYHIGMRDMAINNIVWGRYDN